MSKITQEYLKEHFSYHKDGYLIRKKYLGGPKVTIVRGSKSSSKYLSTRILGKSVLMHRMIFLLLKGWLPEFLDHKDQNRHNNRIENLRPSTKKFNCFHRKVSSKSTSKVRGVDFHKAHGTWRGRVVVDGKSIHIASSKNKKYVVDKVVAFQQIRLNQLLDKNPKK